MKKRHIQLYAVSLVLVALLVMSQSGITHATPQVPEKILSDTPVGSDPFSEGLELVAAEDTALIAQYYQWGGQKFFPLDYRQPAFKALNTLYIISSNQNNWHNYWPRSIMEFRDGATVVFQFSQGLDASLTDAASIIPVLNTWMGTTLDILHGGYANETKTTTLYYWGYMSPQNHSDFIYDEFYDIFSSGGYTNFITDEVIASAPVSVVATGLTKPADEWIPLAVTSIILENGITIDKNDVHNMSIGSAFNYSGSIIPASGSQYSRIEFKLPYVANVFDSHPDTDNLYPELTGGFNWTLKAGTWIDKTYSDIFVTYDMAVEEFKSFPQITSEVDVDVSALRSTTDPLLNYTINMTNTGDEPAYDVSFAWDLGDQPAPKYIQVFDSEKYKFNKTVKKYYNMIDGKFYDSYQGQYAKILVEGWFTYLNGTLVPPISEAINDTTPQAYMVDLGQTYQSVLINKSFFTFNYSNNLIETTLENGNFALQGTINELVNGSSEHFWWSIGDLPAQDDTFLILGWNVTEDNSTQPFKYNITIIDNTSAYGVGNNLADYIVQEQLAQGVDLRFPSLNPYFIPGVMFRYADNASREYFGWSNGLVVQLYDDEAILKTVVSLNSTIYEIDQVAQIDVTIENIGDATATNVQVQGFHAQLGPDWQIRDTKEFSGEETVGTGTINPGQKEYHTFIRPVTTFLGIHPVGVTVDYTTEESDDYDGAFNRTDVGNVTSNLIVALVLPKPDKAGEDEPSYPAPEVNVSVSWIDENGGNLTNSDIVEIKTKVRNTGDEATTIIMHSYFPTRMGSLNISGSYDGHTFKVTDGSGNILDDTHYDQGFAFDWWELPISIAGVGGLHLAPEASIVFYYKVNLTDVNSFILPPVQVKYDSRFPMAGASGVEGAGSGDGESSSSITDVSSNLGMKTDTSSIRFSILTEDSGSSSWTSYSGASLLAAYAAVTPSDGSTPVTTSGGVNGFTTLTSFIQENMRLMIVVLAIPIVVLGVREVRRTRKK